MKLEFQTERTITRSDGSSEIYLDIRPDFQVFLGYLLEGLDGFCYHTISDPPPEPAKMAGQQSSSGNAKKLLKVTVTPAYYQLVKNFLEDIQGYEI